MNTGLDFGNAEKKEPKKYLGIGVYTCKVIDANFGRAKNGTQFLELTWESGDVDTKGCLTKETIWLTSKNAGWIKWWAEVTLNIIIDSPNINEKCFISRYATVTVKKQKDNDYLESRSGKHEGLFKHNIKVSASKDATSDPIPENNHNGNNNNYQNNENYNTNEYEGYEPSVDDEVPF